MKTSGRFYRTIGGRKILVQQIRIKISQISESTRFQPRDEKNASRRANEIARACREAGSTSFTDSPIVIAVGKGRYDLVAGFGRRDAANLMDWQELVVDVLVGESDNDQTAEWVARVDNNRNHVVQTPLTQAEEAKNIYALREVMGVTAAETAAAFHVSEATIAKRTHQGRRLLEKKRTHLSQTKLFRGGPDAAATLVKLFNQELGKNKFQSYEAVEEFCAGLGVRLMLYSVQNSANVQGVAFRAITDSEFKRFLVFTYSTREGARAADDIKQFNEGGKVAAALPQCEFLFLSLEKELRHNRGLDMIRFLEAEKSLLSA